jgi:ubiquinone/menaquinone biosynthesis C-methylase UbiE
MDLTTTSSGTKNHQSRGQDSRLLRENGATDQREASTDAGGKWSDQRIEEYWREQAQIHGKNPQASWSDVRVIEMEMREIIAHITDNDKVLDVGCANGFTTLRLAQARQIDITGVDYIPEMIQNARTALREASKSLRGAARFDIGNTLALPFPEGTFDKVTSVRVIINLGKWERQLTGLAECVRVLKPKGRLILSEATLQGWSRLNQLRYEWNLPAIPIPHFNNYLDEDLVRKALEDSCDLVEIKNFASSYYVGTRVLKPLIAKLAGREDQIANPMTELNRWFALLPAGGDYGTQKIFVFRKKE